MKFSIVLPVYNAQQFITQTIESVLQQTYKDFELIIINDGSKDSSDEICKSYQKEDSRIQYTFIENHGVSYARNRAINMAKGEYLLFLDADDFLPLFALEKWAQTLKRRKEGFDVVFANYSEMVDEVEKKKEFPFMIEELEKKDLDFCLHHVFGGEPMIGWSVWKQCYRTSIILENKVYFNETMNMAEDGNWIFSYLIHCSTFSACKESLYYYRVMSGESLTGQYYGYDLFKSSTQFYTTWYAYFKNEYQGSSRMEMMQRLAQSYTNAASSIGGMKKIDYERSVRLLEEHKEMLYNSKRKAHRILSIFLKLFGLKAYVYFAWYTRNLKNKVQGRRDTE